MHQKSLRLIATSLLFLLAQNLFAQQEFLLEASQLGIRSSARISGSTLEIRSDAGSITAYARDSRYDSADGRWFGYFSRSANQVLRWPASNSGNMQIGTPQVGSVAFRTSQMTIRPLAVAQNIPTPAPMPKATSPQLGQSGTLTPRVSNRPTVPVPAPAIPSPSPTLTGPSGTVVASPQLAQAGGLLTNLAVSKLFNLVANDMRRSNSQMLRLASYDTRGNPWLMSRAGSSLRTISRPGGTGTDWWVSPVGQGYVRVQSYDRGRLSAVGVNRSGKLSLLPLSQDPRQLWRVTPAAIQNRFHLQNVGIAGQALGHQGGQLVLQPIAYGPTQMWSPYTAPVLPSFQPFLRSVSTEVVANAQLPPARVTLENRHRNALILLLGDSRKGDSYEKIRIEPNQSQTISLERDSGATLVETVEVRSATGLWDSQRYVTAIPPQAFYDLSVYEEHLQSIAIDATGKSPNPIEDVNYMPKSVGWLPVPAGPELPSSMSLDVYNRAKDARNPGAVRRMKLSEFEPEPKRPLEDILEKYQSVPRRKF